MIIDYARHAGPVSYRQEIEQDDGFLTNLKAGVLDSLIGYTHRPYHGCPTARKSRGIT